MYLNKAVVFGCKFGCSKIYIKLCIKSNQEGEQISFNIMNRTTAQQTHAYGIFVWGHDEIFKISYAENASVHTRYALRYSPHRKLQQITMGYFETVPHSGCWSAWKQLQFFLKFNMFVFMPLISFIKAE